MTIFRGPGGTGSATSDTDTTEFQEFLVQSQAARDAALAAQSAAELAETNAETAETNAETAATSAISSAASATGSASAAATSATNAANSATSATNSATAAAASAASVNDTNLVHISGTETITGIKTFSQPITGSVTGTSANVTGTVAISNGGTGSITASSARTALGVAIGTDVQAYSPNLATYASTGIGFRNRIINGDMRIDQRNAGASVSNIAGSIYTLDRWAVTAAQASKITIQRNAGTVTPPAGFTNYLGITSSSSYPVTANESFSLEQTIEGFNVADLNWGTASAVPATLSFWVRSSLTGTFGGSIATTKTAIWVMPFSYTVSVANTWTYVTVSVTAPTATGGANTDNTSGVFVRFGLGATGTSAGGTAGVWTSAGNFMQPAGTGSVVGTNGATFYITGVQLEAGTVATPFERRDYGSELIMCQRYYETGLYNFTGYTTAGSGYGQRHPFKVSKRATPTMTTSGTSSINASSLGLSANDISSFQNSAYATATGIVVYSGTFIASSEL